MVIKKIIQEYLLKFKEEEKALNALIDFKNKYNQDKDLISRKNFEGHITSSAILVSRKSKKMLKIYNDSLKLDLQPGGHILEGLNPLENARRILKELGLIKLAKFVPDNENELIPLDIDTHTIPANSKLNEPEHFHHDFRYLFVCEDEFVLEKEYIWENIPELKKSATYLNLIDKVQFLWSKEYFEKQFYNSIANKVSTDSEVSFIVVQHFLPGVEHFLRSLESIGTVRLSIPKPKSVVFEIQNRLEKLYPVKLISREELTNNKDIIKILESYDNIIFVDIGGWFANDLPYWYELYPDKIIGVIEDTENGHQKYSNIKPIPCPIVSVARSPLKLNEDTLIGQSIVFSADSILRQQNKLIKYMNCGVLGYGKVGKSIAYDLMGKSIKPIVYETNPLKLIEAYNDGCSIGDRIEVFKSCDSIFCATGNKSISVEDLPLLKRGTYLFSVTSADDEFRFSTIKKDYKEEIIDDYISRYYKFENSFFLVNKGNAVNFIHKAVVGDFIHLVKAEMLLAINALTIKFRKAKIFEVNSKTRKIISEIWLKHFRNINFSNSQDDQS